MEQRTAGYDAANPPGPAGWLVLGRTPGLGPRGAADLVAHFGSIDAVFAAPRRELERALPGRPEAVGTLLAGAVLTEAERDWLADPGHQLVTWDDADYPRLLRELPGAPPVLYVHGDRRLLGAPQLAVVGSRNPTADGRDNAREFAAALARAGLCITSGLALGVDGAAHEGALAGGGTTLAVAGTGLDRVYPPAHRALAHRIAVHGALVSEFPLGTPPRRENFPQRNRLLSGLSLGVLVVEAAVGSGSLITARSAAEQGREVFAIPGSIHSPQSRGCHALIRQGAKLVETAQDVLEELAPLVSVTHSDAKVSAADAPAGLEPGMAQLLDCLGYEPVGIDQLVERSGLTAGAISSMLLKMELKGLIAACPGGKFQRTSAS